jgi:hypothetical protein
MSSFHEIYSSDQSRVWDWRDGIKPGLICVGVFAFAIATAIGLKSANPARSITVAPPAGVLAGASFGGNEPSRAPGPTESFPVLAEGGPAFGFVIFDWPSEAGIAGFEPRLAPQP